MRTQTPRESLLALLAVLVWTPAAAETVALRSATHDGYGRLVFNWSAPVGFSAGIDKDRLRIRFDRPVEASYGKVVKTLGKYLRRAEPGADGRSVTFVLGGAFGLRSFDLGTLVVVDILDDPKASLPDPQPDATARSAGEAPLVPVRWAEHEGYSRVVFDWRRKVPYRLRQSADEVTIAFDRAARINLGALGARPPPYVGNPRVRQTEAGVEVLLGVPAGSRLRHFSVGNRVVIDVMAPTGAPTEAPTGADTRGSARRDVGAA